MTGEWKDSEPWIDSEPWCDGRLNERLSFNGESYGRTEAKVAGPTKMIAFIGEFLITDNSNDCAIFSVFDDEAKNFLSLIVGEGKLSIKTYGYTDGQGKNDFNDGKPHKFRLSINIVNGNCALFIDGNLELAVTHKLPSRLGNSQYAQIGAASLTTDSSIRDKSTHALYSFGIKVDGMLMHDWQLDSPDSAIQADSIGGVNMKLVNVKRDDWIEL